MKPKWTIAVMVAAAFGVASAASVDARSRSDQSGMQHERSMPGSSGWEKISGTIKKTKSVSLRGLNEENLIVQLKTKQGRKKIVDLGNADRVDDLDLDKGDQITAWGRTVTIGDKQVFMAHKVRANDETMNIERHRMSGHSTGSDRGGDQADFGPARYDRQQSAFGHHQERYEDRD